MHQLNYKNGFLLIELCICLGIISFIVPSSVVINKQVSSTISKLEKELITVIELENKIEEWRYSGFNNTNGQVHKIEKDFEKLKINHHGTNITILRKK